ncbi:hypothetical protein IAR50_001596 [Cryptococcus sp. DSM 104548]
MHHVPNTGDLPNTVSSTAQSGMIITPHNYLYSDPSGQASQQIRIDYNNNATTDVTPGAMMPLGSMAFDHTWDPYTYYGDIAVLKFPYDHDRHPYDDTE